MTGKVTGKLTSKVTGNVINQVTDEVTAKIAAKQGRSVNLLFGLAMNRGAEAGSSTPPTA